MFVLGGSILILLIFIWTYNKFLLQHSFTIMEITDYWLILQYKWCLCLSFLDHNNDLTCQKDPKEQKKKKYKKCSWVIFGIFCAFLAFAKYFWTPQKTTILGYIFGGYLLNYKFGQLF